MAWDKSILFKNLPVEQVKHASSDGLEQVSQGWVQSIQEEVGADRIYPRGQDFKQ